MNVEFFANIILFGYNIIVFTKEIYIVYFISVLITSFNLDPLQLNVLNTYGSSR